MDSGVPQDQTKTFHSDYFFTDDPHSSASDAVDKPAINAVNAKADQSANAEVTICAVLNGVVSLLFIAIL